MTLFKGNRSHVTSCLKYRYAPEETPICIRDSDAKTGAIYKRMSQYTPQYK